MKTEEICRKYVDFGKEEMKTLIYCLVEDSTVYEEKTAYGVSVEIPEKGESVCISDLTTYKEEAEHLLDLLATGFVTPVAVKDIVEDWLGR